MIRQCRIGNQDRHSILLEWRLNSFSYFCANAKLRVNRAHAAFGSLAVMR